MGNFVEGFVVGVLVDVVTELFVALFAFCDHTETEKEISSNANEADSFSQASQPSLTAMRHE